MAKSRITAEQKARRAQLGPLMEGAGIKSMEDIQELFKDMIATFVNQGLEGELEEELGYSKYDFRNKDTDNSRNGHSEKTLKTSYGDVDIQVPRDRKGEFEPELTKAISRFARNTVTLLETVRELKLLGVDVFFERENIHSMSGDGELMLTILASFAQEESLSTSENCKWRIRNDFKQGKPGNLRIYGYRMKKGKLVVEAKEAEIVRMIFHNFLDGMGRNLIMKKLREMGAKTLQGSDFRETQIHAMLRNEKYAGDLLLQKTFVATHPEKQYKKNNGELPMYLVRDAHEAIIDRETFTRVQEELKRRAEEWMPAPKGRDAYPFTGIITCGNCGKHFRRKVVVSPGYAPRIVWICATFNTLGKKACPSKQIPEPILMETAASALNIPVFDEQIFTAQVREIRVPAANRLVFVLKDGQEIEREWEDHSRRDSWDEAARQKAREHAGRRYAK